MARNETSRLKITIDIDKATGKILAFNQTLGNTEKKVRQTGGAMTTLATQTNQAGQSAAASAVNFQTFSMGLLNLSTSAIQTYTSISNLDRAQNRAKMSVIAVARAEDLLANKQQRATEMREAGTAGGQKYINILREIETAEQDLIVKTEKKTIEQNAVNDVYMLFAGNIANVAISSMQTIAVMDKNQIILTKAKIVAQKLSNLSIFASAKANYIHATSMSTQGRAAIGTRIAVGGLTVKIKALTIATRAFMMSNPILIAALVAGTAALAAYETNFMGLKDAIHGTTEETKSFEEQVNDTRNSVVGLDDSINDLDKSVGFKLPDSMESARVALIRYGEELGKVKEDAIKARFANLGLADSMDQVQKKTTDNPILNLLLGNQILQSAHAEEIQISSLGAVRNNFSGKTVVGKLPNLNITEYEYALNQYGHTIKRPIDPQVLIELQKQDQERNPPYFTGGSTTALPFTDWRYGNLKGKMGSEYADSLGTGILTDTEYQAMITGGQAQEMVEALSLGISYREYQELQTSGKLEDFKKEYTATKAYEYSYLYKNDPKFRADEKAKQSMLKSMTQYSPKSWNIMKEKELGRAEDKAERDKKLAVPRERIILSSLANKIYQEQFGSFYSPSGKGTGFNPKQYTNLVRQEAAKQGIDLSKYKGIVMNGINLSTGEEEKTLREKAGYEMPDKPKGSDFRKRLVGKASGIYDKDDLSLGMQLLLDRDYDEGGLLGKDLDPMEERLRIMAKYDIDVGMGGGEEEAIMDLHYKSLGDSRKDLISEYLVGGETFDGGKNPLGLDIPITLGDRNISGTTPFQQREKSLGRMTKEQMDNVNAYTSMLTNNARAAATRYNEQVIQGEATGAAAAAIGAAERMGRETWNREQAAQRTSASGGVNVMHWLPTGEGVTDADRAAFQSLAKGHSLRIKDEVDKVKQSGRERDLGGMRHEATQSAIRLRDSILKRIADEKLAAANYASILGISAVSALATLRDQSQGEQTLMDQVAYQQRLDAMSSGVV